MTRARLLALTSALLGAVTCAFACSDSRDGFAPDDSEQDASSPDSSVNRDGAAADAAPPPLPRGVVLVHAAAFPSFRLCFENYPELSPQPDSTIMPNANVVGVEVGSAVRIDPLDRAPGRVFVIDRGEVEAPPGNDRTCGSLICQHDGGPLGDGCLRRGLDYGEIAPISKSLGTDRVELLAIAGCANGIVLGSLGVDPAACGEDWRLESGNLSAQIVELSLRVASPELGLPVQFVHLAPMLAGGRLEISFGPLSKPGKLDQTVAEDPRLFRSAAPATLQVARDESSSYGTHGFRIILTRSSGNDGGDASAGDDSGLDAGTSIVVDQSLAEIQDLSAPRDVPANYYRADSNNALLLLGDPSIKKTLENGSPNPSYSARRALHLLALPILDPKALDASPGSVESGATGGR